MGFTRTPVAAYRHRQMGSPSPCLYKRCVCAMKRDTDYTPVDGYLIVRPSLLPVAKRDSLFVGRPVPSSCSWYKATNKRLLDHCSFPGQGDDSRGPCIHTDNIRRQGRYSRCFSPRRAVSSDYRLFFFFTLFLSSSRPCPGEVFSPPGSATIHTILFARSCQSLADAGYD